MEIGFGSASLRRLFDPGKLLSDDLDVRASVVRHNGTTAALLVADFVTMWVSTCLRIRSRVARLIGIPPENVGIFCTQNHGALLDGAGPYDVEAADRVFEKAALNALRAVQPAEHTLVATTPTEPLVICRRIPFRELGAFTFFYGYRLDARGRPDASRLLGQSLRELARGMPVPPRSREISANGDEESEAPRFPLEIPGFPIEVPGPVSPPAASDSLLQGIFFRTLSGKPIGAVLRFAAHPVTANRAGADWHSGDYPAYARRELERRFGGTALFLTGPCGDQAPPVGGKSLALAHLIGESLARAACGALNRRTWRRDGPVAVSSPVVELPVRNDYPADVGEARRLAAQAEAELKGAAARGDLASAKRLSERYEMLSYVTSGSHRSWSGEEFLGMAGQPFRHPLFLLRIGDAVIAGLPGEPFGAYGPRLRERSLGDRLIVAEEANGYLSYLHTADEYPKGGYGPSAAIFGPAAEQALVAATLAGVESLMSNRS